MRVLILGGYGTFGGRLARLLAGEPRFTLLIAGRSAARAAAFCAALPPGAGRVPLAFDRDGDVAAQLRAAAPDVVVDASGPFQAYGADPWRVVAAALAQRVAYLDLADGAAFVAGIAAFDAAARAAGVFALSGVSSFPVLTDAALRALGEGLAVDSVAAGIAPSPRAGIGRAVVGAIASYAGRPVGVLAGGARVRRTGLGDARRVTVAPPGHLPLASRRFVLVEAPDLDLLPAAFPGLRDVWTGAGPAPALVTRILGLLARLVRWRLLPSLAPFAGAMHRAGRWLRWGEHRGGMFVAIAGRDGAGRTVRRAWHLVAEGDDGPFIPAMPAAAILRRCLDGAPPAPGARPALAVLALADLAPLFAARRIVAGIRETMPDAAPLYRRILGPAWDRLPPALRALHDIGDRLVADGVATVERGGGWGARAAAALFGFPRAGTAVPVTVTFTRRGPGELWQRDFAGRVFRSLQRPGRGRADALVEERFGPLTVGLAVVADGDGLQLVVRRWSLLGIPLPRRLAPGGQAREHASAADGRFHFDVALAHPFVGLIVRYRGWLVPRAPGHRDAAQTSASISASVGKRPV